MADTVYLPQLDGKAVTCGGGLGTWLQFVDGFTFRHFCLFELLDDPRGLECITDFHRKYIAAAVAEGFGAIIEGLHYRASRDWGGLIGYGPDTLEEINIRGIDLYRSLAKEFESPETPMIVAGAIGPRGDAYDIGRTPDAAEAEDYHSEQIQTFRKAGADMVTAMTFTSPQEAIGITRAAKAMGMPVVISFFVAKGGKLTNGQTLHAAISEVDEATGGAPAYYMINCTHPTEFDGALTSGEWIRRLGGFMPNAVSMETLDLCTLGHLEDGDPVELGGQMAALARRYPHINVWGGCCGTDGRHAAQIARQVMAVRRAAG